MKKLSENVYVLGQIRPDDLPAMSEAGIKTIINNRPDGEIAGQPTGDDIKIAAENQGMQYVAIPIAGGFTLDQVESLRAILKDENVPVLAYCASGTRSALLWALSQAGQMTTDDILEAARKAGYEFGGYADMIESVKDA